MKFIETKFNDAYLIELVKIGDERGYFGRIWCENILKEKGLNTKIAQINTSFNAEKGTLRGLHYQKSPHEEAKIISCIKGSIFDVIVDLRPDSSTYLQWQGFHLNETERTMLYVPEGFAHGYQATSNDTAIIYPTTEFYAPESEAGVRWNDPSLNIEWPLDPTNLSKKDASWPNLNT